MTGLSTNFAADESSSREPDPSPGLLKCRTCRPFWPRMYFHQALVETTNEPLVQDIGKKIAVVVIPRSSRYGCATCLAQGRNRRRISNGSIELASIDNAVIVPLK